MLQLNLGGRRRRGRPRSGWLKEVKEYLGWAGVNNWKEKYRIGKNRGTLQRGIDPPKI